MIPSALNKQIVAAQKIRDAFLAIRESVAYINAKEYNPGGANELASDPSSSVSIQEFNEFHTLCEAILNFSDNGAAVQDPEAMYKVVRILG